MGELLIIAVFLTRAEAAERRLAEMIAERAEEVVRLRKAWMACNEQRVAADRRAALAAQLPDKWRERAVALTDDRQVMRDDRVAARILRTCADQLAEALAGLLAKK